MSNDDLVITADSGQQVPIVAVAAECQADRYAVERPTAFVVEVRKEGYAYYWGVDDWRAACEGTGTYPLAMIAVLPLNLQQQAPQFLVTTHPEANPPDGRLPSSKSTSLSVGRTSRHAAFARRC